MGWEIGQTPSAQLEAGVGRHAELADVLEQIRPTLSSKSQIQQTASAESESLAIVAAFPLSWSHYVRLMSVEKLHARAFYETEAVRGGWSVRQLDRQIATQFF